MKSRGVKVVRFPNDWLVPELVEGEEKRSGFNLLVPEPFEGEEKRVLFQFLVPELVEGY